MALETRELEAAFAALERHWGMEERPSQREFARAVLAALTEGRIAFLEAGPGTGKTFGYLVPLVLLLQRGGRAVIATRTRTLQEQLWQSDLPAVLASLGAQTKVALLKGRENYLCWRRFEEARRRLLPEELLGKLTRWAEETETGDLEELADLGAGGEGKRLLSEIRDVPLLCSGPACPFYRQCFSRLAREKAREADLVVVNHALLGADMVSAGRILGSYDYLVVDEAHGLPAALRHALTLELTPQTTSRLLAALGEAGIASAGEFRELRDAIANQARLLWETIGPGVPEEAAAYSPEELAAGWEHADSLIQLLGRLAQRLSEEAGQLDDEEREILTSLGQEAGRLAQTIEALIYQTVADHVYWREGGKGEPALYASPIELAPILSASLWDQVRGAVLTSATLASSGQVWPLARELGASKERVLFRSWPSPFSYQGVGAFVVTDLPQPDAPAYPKALAEVIASSLETVPRRALVLFTSRKLLAAVREFLTDFPVLAQGWDGERDSLLRRFRSQSPPIVLLGLDTMWEGVDLPGEALELLFITRLPFPVPTDPLAQAEASRLQEQGQEPFKALFLPKAVLKLRQGVGRLVRAEGDRGAIVITDVRAATKSYGAEFLAELPVVPKLVRKDELPGVLKALFGASRSRCR